jgi:hypothetical protein
LLIVDQALYSISSFLPVMIIAKFDGSDAVGAFAVCAGINAVALSITQGLATDAGFVLKRGSATADSAIAAAVSAPLACVTAVVAAVLAPEHWWLALGILVMQPLQASQFALRSGALLLGRDVRLALASDAIAVLVLLMYGIVCWFSASADWRVTYIAWCVAAGVAILPFAERLRRLPRPRLSAELRARWVIGRAFAVEPLITQAGAQMIIWVTAALAGIAVAGSLRIAQQAMFPLLIGIAASRSVVMPYLDRHKLSLAKSTGRIAVTLAIAAVVVGVVIYALPLSFGALFFGQAWTAAREAIPWTGMLMGTAAIAFTISISLRIAREQRSLLLARTTSATLQLISVVLACALFSDAGGIAAVIAVVMLLSVVPWLIALRQASNRLRI